ncbi:MAG: 5-deoxy-glucuronate isomerase [Dethiobacter sp.]|jgi:5-deoxy-glucuronate isomerase|nr:5-deoxy-glucuronate isomerase [Dethiobacter sp.]
MVFKQLGQLKKGYNKLSDITDKDDEMMMDTGIFMLDAGMEIHSFEAAKESAFLLLDGCVRMEWENQAVEIKRNSLFAEKPWCLHVPKDVSVKIVPLSDAEILRQMTVNKNCFMSKLYSPAECREDIFGESLWEGTAKRLVRTVFDYLNAPYSNMTIGEVINYPGNWSSYIPHHHPQPEIYYYRFDKPQGFGCSIVGDKAYKIVHNSASMIPGGLVHPQVSAPGYTMYYCWMIRHLDNDPWTCRIEEEQHKWLLKSI